MVKTQIKNKTRASIPKSDQFKIIMCFDFIVNFFNKKLSRVRIFYIIKIRYKAVKIK